MPNSAKKGKSRAVDGEIDAQGGDVDGGPNEQSKTTASAKYVAKGPADRAHGQSQPDGTPPPPPKQPHRQSVPDHKRGHRRNESSATDDGDWRNRKRGSGSKHSSWHGPPTNPRRAARLSDFAAPRSPSLSSPPQMQPGVPWATPTYSAAEFDSWRAGGSYLTPVSDDYLYAGPSSPTSLLPLTQIMPMSPPQYMPNAGVVSPAEITSPTPSFGSPSSSKRSSFVSSDEAKKALQNSPLSAIALAEVAQQAAMQRNDKQLHTSPIKSGPRRHSQTFEMSDELSEVLNSEPSIPPPIPSLFMTPLNDQSGRTSLLNPSRTSNVYIRGLPLDTTDDGLYAICRRFGVIVSSKAIIDVQSGTCKGFGFCEFKEEQAARDCIVALTHYGYQVSFAKDSFNDRLVNLRDAGSTNLYLSNLPLNFSERVSGLIFSRLTLTDNAQDIEDLFYPQRILSQRILRDADGLSRGVGFARFETREDCDDVIARHHNTKIGKEPTALPLQIRYADSPDQKRLKTQTQQRRQWRAREYNSEYARSSS